MAALDKVDIILNQSNTHSESSKAKPRTRSNGKTTPMVELGNTQVKVKQERVFETPFEWTIIRNVSSKKRQTIYSESAELGTTCAAV